MTWKTDISDFDKVDIPKAKFIFEQAKDRLGTTLESGKIIENKLNILAGFFVVIVAGLVTFSLSHLDISVGLSEQDWLVVGPAILLVIYFSVFLYVLYVGIRPRDYYPAGNEPRKLYTDQICSHNLKNIILSEIETYQTRIEKNMSINEAKASKYNLCVLVLLFSPLAALAAVLITLLFLRIVF